MATIDLTPYSLIWTGDKNKNDTSFLTSGFRGSLRWWYEAFVRGLGSYACDPVEQGCTLSLTRQEQQQVESENSLETRAEKTKQIARQHICPACYLFGCTGWKSRFILPRAREQQLRKGETYTYEIIERLGLPIEAPEWMLLGLVAGFVTEHGSICAKNVLKPSEDTRNRNHKNTFAYRKKSHVDYGLCALEIQPPPATPDTPTLTTFLKGFTTTGTNRPKWPDFRYFWYTACSLDRLQINTMVNRNRSGRYSGRASSLDRWMGGNNAPLESKKIFSFHGVETGGRATPRVWGYCQANKDGRAWLEEKWPGQAGQFSWGKEYLRTHGVNND